MYIASGASPYEYACVILSNPCPSICTYVSLYTDINFTTNEKTDIYDYLKRVKIKNKKISLEKCIDKYIERSCLSEDSRDYIAILLMIPYGTLNIWYKYAYGRNKYSYEEQLKKIKLLSDSEF